MKKTNDNGPIRDRQSEDKPVKITKRNGKWRKRSRLIVATIGSALLVLVGALVIVGGISINNLLSAVNQDPQSGDASYTPLPVLPSGATVPPEEIGLTHEDFLATNVGEIELRGDKNTVKNFLLIGTDKSAGLNDTNIILSINMQKQTISLVSLLRDTLVLIPGYDYDHDGNDDYFKLNSAFASGGFERLRKTIQANYRLDIDRYVQVDFSGFAGVVNKMGGVDMELTAAEAVELKVGTQAGTYALDGNDALRYVRIRRLDNDFGRTNRQRKMLMTLFNKAKKLNMGEMYTVLYGVLTKVTTNMSKDEMTGLAVDGLMKYASYSLESYSLPHGPWGTDFVYGEIRRGGLKYSVVEFKDLKDSVLELHGWLYGKQDEE